MAISFVFWANFSTGLWDPLKCSDLSQFFSSQGIYKFPHFSIYTNNDHINGHVDSGHFPQNGHYGHFDHFGHNGLTQYGY